MAEEWTDAAVHLCGGISANAAAGTSIRQCPQCSRDLTLIRIAGPNGCFSEFVLAGLDPEATPGITPVGASGYASSGHARIRTIGNESDQEWSLSALCSLADATASHSSSTILGL